jgi:hypothetical protein
MKPSREEALFAVAMQKPAEKRLVEPHGVSA